MLFCFLASLALGLTGSQAIDSAQLFPADLPPEELASASLREAASCGGRESCETSGDSSLNLLQRSAQIVSKQHHAVEVAAKSEYPEEIDGDIDGLPAPFVRKAFIASWIFVGIYTLCVFKDVGKLAWRGAFKKLFATPEESEEKAALEAEEDKPPTTEELEESKQDWSPLAIWMLCFYRLYTGFLAATWLPYVLAMEGEALWPNNQSLFMGIAKLIYGVTVLMNPMFGLVGDLLAESCLGAARRLWILLGIVLSALGIFICLYAGPEREFFKYMLGITLWRLGESLNDVTTEAIVPEMVPTRQFALASSIKAASFLAGGLLGYILLYIYADLHYTWCYFAYLACMFLFAIPSLLLLNNDGKLPPNPWRKGKTFGENLSSSYMTPCSFEGGFPTISFAIFVMSCGTAPMFFLLLIIRDLLGVHSMVTLQRDFAISSMLFFLAASVFATIDVMFGDRVGPQQRLAMTKKAESMSPEEQAEALEDAKNWEREKIKRIYFLVVLSMIFALSVAILPSVQFLPTIAARFTAFYPLVTLFGATFGLGYSRFQDATWRLLPKNIDMANAMGFNVMCRNFGLGVGNFFFGAMLEFFKVHHSGTTILTTTTTYGAEVQALTNCHEVYRPLGYDFMCLGCMILNISAGLTAYTVLWRLPDPDKMEHPDDRRSTPDGRGTLTTEKT